MQPWSLLLAVALALPMIAAVEAQERDDADLRAIFERQIETFRAVRESPNLGATRGLVLAPVEGPAAEVVRVEPVATPEAAGQGAGQGVGRLPPQLPDPAAPDRVSAPADAPVVHAILPADQQHYAQVRFAFDSAAIAETERPKLRQLCAVMDEMGIQLFRIIGHTDATGDAVYNQRLSMRRAEEVRRFFMDDCGIAGGRLEAIGVGKQFPLNEQDPFAGENRRVEFQAMG